MIREQECQWQECACIMLTMLLQESHMLWQERSLHTCYLSAFVTKYQLLEVTPISWLIRKVELSWTALTVCQPVNYGQTECSRRWTILWRKCWRPTRTWTSEFSTPFPILTWNTFVTLLKVKLILILTFLSPCWRSLNHWNGHVFTIPKRSQRIAKCWFIPTGSMGLVYLPTWMVNLYG